MDGFHWSFSKSNRKFHLSDWPNIQITHSLLWVVALTAVSALPSLPWSYYYNFILEEKYGFNKQTVNLWVMDQVKGYALGAIIGLPILAGFLKVIEWAGKGFVPFLMLFM
jgi:STE24 endopeptidase